MVLAAVVLLLAGACSDEDPDPAEERRERIEARLRDSFSGAQARCILDNLDEPTLAALDREDDLDPGSDEMAVFSTVTAMCVEDPDATTSTTSATTTSTTAPATDDGDAGSEGADEDPAATTTTAAAG